MYGNSRVPVGKRDIPDGVLRATVVRHLSSSWRPPWPAHTLAAFEAAGLWRSRFPASRPLILDSGCGTGRSSVWLARRHPDSLVIGLDKSLARLERAAVRFERPDNLLLLRADCAIFWGLALEQGWRLDAHYLLYPNPWPKPGHLKRRWQGHPAFPWLLRLGGSLELRSNWRPYLEEFDEALRIAGRTPASLDEVVSQEAVTDFEEKYQASGHQLFRLSAELD